MNNQFVEIYDRDMLEHILNYKEYYKDLFVGDNEEDYAQFELYKKYLNKSCGEFKNMVITNYSKINEKGRKFANNSLSLQSFNKKVRGAISKDLYIDIDMVNAHPTILQSITEKNNFLSIYNKVYVDNRDLVINELLNLNPDESRASIKTIILSMIYGGEKSYKNLKIKSEWIKNFKKETGIILKKVKGWYPDLYKEQLELKKNNIVGSTLSKALCIVEDKLLDCMINVFKKNNLLDKVGVLCFDGIMIPKSDLTKINNSIKEIENIYINKYQVNMKLMIKEFDTTLPIEIPLKYLKRSGSSQKNASNVILDIKENYRKSKFYWKDFIGHLKNTIFDSFECLTTYFKENNHKVMFKVYNMEDFIIRKISCENMYQFDKKIPSEVFRYKDVSPSGKVYIKSVSLKKLLDHFGLITNIERYNKLDFRPIGVFENDYIENDDNFNTWTGFQAKLVDEVDMSKINIILNHIRKVWCNDDDIYYNYICSWFKLIFTNPSFKSKVAIVLKSSEKQIGKGIIINDFLIPYIFGNQYSLSVAGLDTITARFNDILMNKLLINSDELSTLDGSYHQSFDVLKKRITDKTAKIEIKGGKSFIYPDYCNYIMCTNNDFTIKVEMGDCRYFILDCSPCYKSDYSYFKKLSDSLNQEAANHFMTYMSKKNTGIVDVRDIPMTDLKKDMMLMSLRSPNRFLIDVKNGVFEIRCYKCDDKCDDKNDDKVECACDEIWISSSHLYNHYIKWCDINNEPVLSLQKFGRDIKDNVDKKKNSCLKINIKSIKFNIPY